VTSLNDVEVTEHMPGEHHVVVANETHTVLLPAGVGVPGCLDEDVVAAAVLVLRRRGRPLPEPLDLSAVLAREPDILVAIEHELEDQTDRRT
jgi:hypothetical protein